jgi:hypothetical protein
LVAGLLDGPVVDGAVEPPDPDAPMFGQFALEPVWVRGVVVPPDGAVVAFGAGEADGSAARTTAVPPTTRRPTASATVAIVRRMPPNTGVEAGGSGTAGSADGEYDAGSQAGGGWAGCDAGWSFQLMRFSWRGAWS